MKTQDFLVIGGGIAGLTFALTVAEAGKVTVLFKKGLEQSSTAWAQGGIAAVTEEDDDFSLHVEDTLKAGAGLCKREVVESIVGEGPARIEELIRHGVIFDKDDSSHYHLHREGGHSRRRIFHAADATGSEIQRALLAKAKSHPNIEFIPYSCAVDLITSKKHTSSSGSNRVLGAYVLRDSGEVETFLAHRVLVATGGAGKVYLYTSNPDIATGDGIAMCFRAGCPVGNMEFFQFHPTCLFHPEAKSFLITEAMRGEGATLRRKNGERFMPKYNELAELAPRDIVARAIDHELKLFGEDCVYLDITHKPKEFISGHFPTIYERCRSFGIDITSQPIPVVPAAHFLCGGVVSDLLGRTAVEHLYVAGECAHTGLHGANRLASNSLLEGVVMGHRAALDALQGIDEEQFVSVPTWDPQGAVVSEEQVIISQNWDEVRRYMWNYVGIVRSTKRLERALRRTQLIAQEIKEYYWNFLLTPDLLELRNLALVAELIIRSALEREESRGLHYTVDFPEARDEYKKDTIISPEEFA